MLVGARFPTKRSGGGVDRVHIPAEIAEIRGSRIEYGCGPHARRRRIRPVNASGACVERIDRPVVGSHENLAAENRRRSEGRGDSWKSKRPFELELGCRLPGESRGARRLKASVGRVGPAVPIARQPLWLRRTSRGRENGLRARGPEKLRDRFPLDRADAVADLLHLSVFEGRQDRLPRHLLQRPRQRSAYGVVLAMAPRTARLKKRVHGLSGASAGALCGAAALRESRRGSDDENQ